MKPSFDHPFAITMWDFSWLERRWPGAGYEDWDAALSELAERGYDAVRIDPYPHLVAADPDREWQLLPNWDQQSWGAQSVTTVTPLPALTEFMSAASRYGVRVALSSWYREDRDNTRMAIHSAAELGQLWVDTLRHVEDAGLLDTVIYVDLCNEFPMANCAPWLYSDRLLRRLVRKQPPDAVKLHDLLDPQYSRRSPELAQWMADSIGVVREVYPDLDYTYSFCDELMTWPDQDVRALDVMEPHIWMSSNEHSDFDDRVGYGYEAFASTGYDNLVAHARDTYEENRQHYDDALHQTIDTVAEWSRAVHKGLYTTECWAVTDWKDWPGLEWDWILDVNARAVEYALPTKRWVGVATSNHCGPQFVGMWREVAWHQRLTALIKSATIDEDIRSGRAWPAARA